MKPAVILLACTLTAGIALAQPADQPMNRREGGRMGGQMGGQMAMMKKLNLTEDQQTQARKLHIDFQKKQIQNRARIQLARLDLGQLLQADKPDRSAIEKAMRDIASMETDAKLAKVDEMIAFRNLLTPDQQKIMKEQRMNRWRGMRGRTGMFRHPGMGMGLLGDNAPPPDGEMADLAPLPEQFDGAEPLMPLDEMDPGDIGAE
jgi:Spy/CpxP family protein refolding chaperone